MSVEFPWHCKSLEGSPGSRAPILLRAAQSWDLPSICQKPSRYAEVRGSSRTSNGGDPRSGFLHHPSSTPTPKTGGLARFQTIRVSGTSTSRPEIKASAQLASTGGCFCAGGCISVEAAEAWPRLQRSAEGSLGLSQLSPRSREACRKVKWRALKFSCQLTMSLMEQVPFASSHCPHAHHE